MTSNRLQRDSDDANRTLADAASRTAENEAAYSECDVRSGVDASDERRPLGAGNRGRTGRGLDGQGDHMEKLA
jgi:hypothetical protein